MALILRADVDKAYGRSNFIKRVASKLAEDYWFPSVTSLGYLSHVVDFAQFCDSQKIKGVFYHRLCTAPFINVQNILIQGGHKIGFHAENTKTAESFLDELNQFKKKTNLQNIDSFTKHGSGTLKLGKHHYPVYEPEKYIEWSSKYGIAYYFGNEICKNKEELLAQNNFFADMFWVEREYRHPDFCEFQQLLDVARTDDVVVLIHPCNFCASKVVSDDFKQLVKLSNEQNVSWKIL
jgi:hypothetical protein